MDASLFLALALGLALGLLVGLQREWAVDEIAGIRTFALITLLGVVAGAVGMPWSVAAGFVALAGLLTGANVLRGRRSDVRDVGLTTEVAALVMYGVGVLLALGRTLPAVVLAGTVAVLLQWKARLHALTRRLGTADVDAIFRLALVALVILPVLPNRGHGPYGVLNPFEIWLMVVLIVGISLAGYLAFRLFGTRGGAVVSGVLGGLISSTATTLSYARREAAEPARAPAAAVVIVIASAVVFARVAVEVLVVAPAHADVLVPPILAMLVLTAVAGSALLRAGGGGDEREVRDQAPPSELGAAIVFGALYAAVLLAVAFARDAWGPTGLFAVAAISGLTDVDAITLSTAQLVNRGALAETAAWRLILVGALANLVFKAGIVVVLGSPALRRRVVQAFGAVLAGGGLVLAFWP